MLFSHVNGKFQLKNKIYTNVVAALPQFVKLLNIVRCRLAYLHIGINSMYEAFKK